MSQHQEFPELTPEALAAYHAAVNAVSKPGPIPISGTDLRRALATLVAALSTEDRQRVGAIVNNLHSPLPPPPTLAEAWAADLHTQDGREVFCAFLATLGEGGQP